MSINTANKSSSSPNMTRAGGGRPKIVLWGDSITQLSFSALHSGFGAHLSDVYQRRADVYNRGYSGYNTSWFLQYCKTKQGYDDILSLGGGSSNNKESSNVKLVTIFFGANDASHPIHNKRQHVPLDTYKSNLAELVALARTHYGKNVKIIVLSPPPVDHDQRLQHQINRYGKEKATGILERTLELSGQYAKAANQVASKEPAGNVAFLDLWTDMQKMEDNNDWCKFLCDGLHLSREGNIFVGDALVKTIQSNFPELAVMEDPITGYWGNSASACGDDVTYFGPWHDEITCENSDTIFASMEKEEGGEDGDGGLKRKRDE